LPIIGVSRELQHSLWSFYLPNLTHDDFDMRFNKNFCSVASDYIRCWHSVISKSTSFFYRARIHVCWWIKLYQSEWLV